MIYRPAEDSYLLAEQVKRFSRGKSFLDIGTGIGIQAEAAIEAHASAVLAIDINAEAIELLKSKKINALKSNLFSNLPKESKFDIIAFNPPYLPKDKLEDKESALTTTGGKKGDELILKFLKQAPSHLNKNGIILLLLSSLTPTDKINSLLKKLNLKSKIISRKKLFMEELFILKISFN